MNAEKKLEKIKEIFETVSVDKDGLNRSTHAALNLAGAIIDLEESGKCDKTVLITLRRVRNQLREIGKVIGL